MHYAIGLLEAITDFGSQWAYIAVLVSSFLEGLPFLGFFSPGGLAVALAGFLSRTGELSFMLTLLISTLAAFSGDMFAFALGQKYGFGFLRKYGQYFFMKDEHRIQRARTLIVTHPGKSLMLGRMYYLTRSISPFLAGASEVPFGVFFFYDLIGCFIWAIIHVGIGFIFGQGFLAASKYFNYVILIAIALIVVIFYTYRFINKRHHVFKKYHVYTLFLNLFSIYLLAKCIDDTLEHESLYRLDRYIYHHIPSLWIDFWIQVMSGVTALGSFNCAAIFIAVLLAILIYKKKWYYTLLAGLSLVSGFISEAFIKNMTHVERPPFPLVATEYWSFPSGHTMLITLVGVLYFHCFRKEIESRWGRALFASGISVIIFGVGFSRIYLNAHWLTDVLAGLALGLFWVTFYILVIRAVRLLEDRPLALLRKLVRYKHE